MTYNKTGDWLHSLGDLKCTITSIDFDSSYPTGGEALTAANLGLSKVEFVSIQSKDGYVFNYDYTNSKVLVYITKDPADTGGADVVLQQVGDTTNLSALTGVKVFAIGR